MSKPFKKINFSLPLSMDTAVPLDYNGFFTSYEEASAAASSAVSAGSSDGLYYIGQNLYVVDNGAKTVNSYVITHDRKLRKVAFSSTTLSGYGIQDAYTIAEANSKFAPLDIVPEQASAENKLADKEFVNDAISTNTASFLGTYDYVSDLGFEPPSSEDDISNSAISDRLSSFEFGQEPSNNDYVFISINITSTGTDGDEYRRFKFSAGDSEWMYEYTLNNSSFTASQWAAINSEITYDAVTSFDSHINDRNNPHGVTALQIGIDPSTLKTKQTAVADPTASGKSLSFISTITQNENGVISPVKRNVTVDSSLDYSSTNPVQNGAVVDAITELKLKEWYPDGSVTNVSQFSPTWDGTNGLKYSYNETSNTASVLPFCKMDGGDDNSHMVGYVVIPPYVDKDGVRYSVTDVSTGSDYGMNENLTGIVAPTTVTSIKRYSFYNCSSLVSVSFPAATSVGNSALNSCSSLTSVSMPAATSIGNYVFNYCSQLTSMSLPAATSVGSNVFVSCTSLKSVYLPAANGIGGNEFAYCTSLTSVDFGSDTRSSIPSLAANSFKNVPTDCVIIVPDANYTAWTAAKLPDGTTDNPWYSLVQQGYRFLKHSEWEYLRKYELPQYLSSYELTSNLQTDVGEIVTKRVPKEPSEWIYPEVVGDSDKYYYATSYGWISNNGDRSKRYYVVLNISYSIDYGVWNVDVSSFYWDSLDETWDSDYNFSTDIESTYYASTLTVSDEGNVFPTFTLTRVSENSLGLVTYPELSAKADKSQLASYELKADLQNDVSAIVLHKTPVEPAQWIWPQMVRVAGNDTYYQEYDAHQTDWDKTKCYYVPFEVEFDDQYGLWHVNAYAYSWEEDLYSWEEFASVNTPVEAPYDALTLTVTGQLGGFDTFTLQRVAQNTLGLAMMSDLETKQDMLSDQQISAIDSVVDERQTEITFTDNTTSAFNWAGTINKYTMIDAGLFDEADDGWIKQPVSVKIGTTVTVIGEYAFGFAFNLSSVTIPDNVTSIGDGGFYNCEGLTSVTIPDSVESIGYDVFDECTHLSSITVVGKTQAQAVTLLENAGVSPSIITTWNDASKEWVEEQNYLSSVPATYKTYQETVSSLSSDGYELKADLQSDVDGIVTRQTSVIVPHLATYYTNYEEVNIPLSDVLSAEYIQDGPEVEDPGSGEVYTDYWKGVWIFGGYVHTGYQFYYEPEATSVFFVEEGGGGSNGLEYEFSKVARNALGFAMLSDVDDVERSLSSYELKSNMQADVSSIVLSSKSEWVKTNESDWDFNGQPQYEGDDVWVGDFVRGGDRAEVHAEGDEHATSLHFEDGTDIDVYAELKTKNALGLALSSELSAKADKSKYGGILSYVAVPSVIETGNWTADDYGEHATPDLELSDTFMNSDSLHRVWWSAEASYEGEDAGGETITLYRWAVASYDQSTNKFTGYVHGEDSNPMPDDAEMAIETAFGTDFNYIGDMEKWSDIFESLSGGNVEDVEWNGFTDIGIRGLSHAKSTIGGMFDVVYGNDLINCTSELSSAISTKQDMLSEPQIQAIDSVVDERQTVITFTDNTTSTFDLSGEITKQTMIDAGLWDVEQDWWLKNPKSARIGSAVTSIGSGVFSYSSLTSVTIPDSVTSIGEMAFYYCGSITSVTIPNSVTSIGESAFDTCTYLTSVTIPDGVTSIEGGAFINCGLTSVTIPNSMTSIGSSVFEGCISLASVTIPDSVTSIGEYAFEGCRSLASVTIPDGVTSIGEMAFDGCVNLTSIIVNDKTQAEAEALLANAAVPSGCEITTWNDASKEWVRGAYTFAEGLSQ